MARYKPPMFEAAIVFPDMETGPQGDLRALDWAEIVARLAAARDLRAVFARPVVQGGGFVPQTAAGIAGEGRNERGVNLAALATGKWPEVTIAAAAPHSGHGDRDN